MITVGDVYDFIDTLAPFSTAFPDKDNVGLLVGDRRQEIAGVCVTLDITPSVVAQAAQRGCTLVVSHHPVIYHGLYRLEKGSVPYELARCGMSAVCAHTNLDAAQGGVNDCLAARLKLTQVTELSNDNYPTLPPMARIGLLPNPMSPKDFAAYVRNRLDCGGVHYTDGGTPVSRVAVCGGSGGDFLFPALQAGADALVTAELAHHQLLAAAEKGLTVVDGGHFATEQVVIQPLADRIHGQFPSLDVMVADQSDPALYL